MNTSPTPLRIIGEFTIFRAAELKPLLLDAPPPSEIDLSGVTEIDTAGVQLLMLAKQAALARNSELRLVGHSPAVLEVFELLNVAAYFSDPLVMACRADASDERASSAASSRKSHGY